MTYLSTHDKTADECLAEIERFTEINANLLAAIKDPTTRRNRRDACSDERERNRDYIKRLESRLRDLETPTPR